MEGTKKARSLFEDLSGKRSMLRGEKELHKHRPDTSPLYSISLYGFGRFPFLEFDLSYGSQTWQELSMARNYRGK